MRFVTAIYNSLHHTSFGGRLNRDKHYLYSLKCLSGMGASITCYTSANDYNDVQTYLNKNHIINVTLKIFELNKMVHHNDILRIKDINKDYYALDNIWEHRCVELMWLKIKWLKDEFENYPDDKIFWIDAGISHEGIFPKKFNSKWSSNYEQTFQNDLAFNYKLLNKLDQLTTSKIFTFYCTNRQHSYPELFSTTKQLDGSIVAGLFGGTEDAVKKVQDKFDDIVDFLLKENALLPEELILTLIYKDNPELFVTYDFDTWYHEDWDCFEKNMKPFSSFFDDLILITDCT